MLDLKNLGNVDLYGLLGVLITATDADVSQLNRNTKVNILQFNFSIQTNFRFERPIEKRR